MLDAIASPADPESHQRGRRRSAPITVVKLVVFRESSFRPRCPRLRLRLRHRPCPRASSRRHVHPRRTVVTSVAVVAAAVASAACRCRHCEQTFRM